MDGVNAAQANLKGANLALVAGATNRQAREPFSAWRQNVEATGKKIRLTGRKLLKSVARPEGFEPPTLRSEV